jgi:hypothetical protein
MKTLKLIFIVILIFCHTILSAQFSKGLLLDGCNNYLEVVNSSSLLMGGKGITIEAWIMPNCDDDNRMIVSKQWCNGEYGYYLSVFNGRLFWSTSPDGFCTDNSNYQTSSIQIPSNVFTHIAVVHDDFNIKLFINGELAPGQFRDGSFIPIYPSFENIRIGAYKNIGGSFGNFFSGIIDELRFYDAPLTAQQIKQNYNVPLSGNEANLVLYYDMEDVTGSGVNLKIENKCAAFSQNRAISKGFLGSRPIIVSNTEYINKELGLQDQMELCGSSSLVELNLDAFKEIKWSTGETTKAINIVNEGLYKVTVETELCNFLEDEIFASQGGVENFESIQLCPNDSIFFNNQWVFESGIYGEILTLPNGCDSITTLDLSFSDSIKTSLDFLICIGDTIKVGQEIYTSQGNFVQNLTSTFGCDSTLFITIDLINEDLLYDFNKCSALVGSTNMDYSEFTSAFSQISCGTIALSNIFRSNPIENKHSCTPGLGNSLAMCVESSSDCTYSAGNDKSVVFSFEVTPEEGKYFQIAKLKFFEKSPLMYDWINGASGINNYPTKFGFRVLKNGVEIYKVEEINSKRDWNEHKITFMNNEAFIAKEKSTYQFEFLPYCPIGNSSSISVWDLENISIFTSCLDKENRVLAGAVTDAEGNPFGNVNVLKQQRSQIENVMTDKNGFYTFNDIIYSDECEISVLKNDDFLNGISTLDLILIQRHILGIETFETSNKYVAADINNDSKISASDLLELRKLILGINESFSNNKSWRFCSELPSFTPSSKVIINEKFTVEHGISDIKNLNFTVIKIGDINNDSHFNNQVENRKYNNCELNYRLNKKLGNEHEIEIYANNIGPLMGLQIALDIQNFEFVKIESSQLNIKPVNYNLKYNNFNFSYSSPTPINIDKSKPIFKIILKSDAISTHFNGLSSNLNNEVYNSDLIPKNVFLRPLEKTKFFKSISVSPNPFDHQTNLEYFSLEPQETNIQIYNTSGKLLISEKFNSTFGLNNIKITSNQFGDLSGLFFVKLFTHNESHVIKLVVK